MSKIKNISITPDQLKALSKVAEDIKRDADPTHSTLRNMVVALLIAHPELSADQATEVCRKLINGITDFTEVYQRLSKVDEDRVHETVYNDMIAHLEGKTPEQQANIMINFIAFVRAIDAQNLSAELSSENPQIVDNFQKFLEESKVIQGAQITPEILEQLRQQLKETVEANTMCLTGIEATKQIIALAEGDQNGTIEDILNEQLVDADTKAYVALAAYIAALNGQLGLTQEVDPTILGTYVAAGVERQEIINKASKGILSWGNAAKLIKLIGEALMVVSFIWFTDTMLDIMAISGLAIATSLISTTLPVAILGIVIGALVSIKIEHWLKDKVATPIAQKISEAYDKVVAYILTGQLKEKIVKSYTAFVNYIQELWTKIVIMGRVIIHPPLTI